MYLVSKLTIYTEHFLQQECLSYEVWLWSSNPLDTSKILGTTEAPNSLLSFSFNKAVMSCYLESSKQKDVWGKTPLQPDASSNVSCLNGSLQ